MSASVQTYWRKLASGKNTGLADKLVLMFLMPLAWLYSTVQWLRVLMYQSGIFKTERLPRPVVSIGNITVGGTGKTPVTSFIAKTLLAQGFRVAVLSRGYGGTLEGQTCIVSDGTKVMRTAAECGDEPYLLASTIPGLMVVTGSDRYSAGQSAMQQFSPDIFLLDDGFQHLRLHRDLNILLLDFTRPFGNSLTLPAGILREPPAAMQRADMMIFTRAPAGAVIGIDTHGIPVSISEHTLVDLLPMESGKPVPFSNCKENKVLAFAGIAEPELFFEGLRAVGLNLVQCINFPDHVIYDQKRADEIVEAMRTSGADLIITTEKDGVKMKGLPGEITGRTLLARLDLTIYNPDNLNSRLAELLNLYKE